MGKEKKSINNKRTIDSTLKGLYTGKITAPWLGFVVLITVYIAASVATVAVSSGGGVLEIGSISLPKASMTGVFSSISNICLFIVVAFYGRIGFFTSLGLLITQFPLILVSIFRVHSYSSIPGLFTNILTVIAISLIFINRNKANMYQQRIVEQAVTDILTGLPNRFAGREYFSELIKKDQKFIYVSADVNNFKSINDTMGYEVGNRILVEIANRWRNLADSGLTGTFDLVAHISGDEFGIGIQEYASEEDVLRTINLYKEELERKITIDDYDYYIIASFGFAEFPVDAKDLEGLISASNLALHDAKRRNNSGIILRYSTEILKSEKSLKIERKIREALDANAVFFHLQPQYDMNHKLRGFEALARMTDTDGSYISPMDFIPVAEKTGLVDRIDMCVFHKAAQFLEEAALQGRTDITISVNISVKHLLKNSFLEDVKSILDSYRISPSQIEIEITESVMVESVERAKEIIEEIKKMGLLVAIDDFGTGFSSLSYLHNFPANLLKIDKSFIDAMSTGESSQKYVASIISIGHVLGLKVISEGVETQEQLEILKEIDCDYIQGYIWGRPVSPEQASKLL